MHNSIMFSQLLFQDFNSEFRIMITSKVDNYISWEKISENYTGPPHLLF